MEVRHFDRKTEALCCQDPVLYYSETCIYFRTRRTGVLGVKIGVIPQWTKEGHKFFVTVLQVGTS